MAVIATAGHVDHGKSTLVRLLTGQEPDRWAQEQRRGLTIDLGYAWTDIGGRRVSLVDVPGHEHFTGNMLAGLGPVAAVMFVVAADDGWCPQSQEHARAIAALNIDQVLLVVTRCDLSPGEAAARVAGDRFAALEVAVAETVLVSGSTGDGIPDLRAALGRLAAAAEQPDAGSPVRLWVDRSFTIRGAGTVVTGTLEAGTIRVDDVLVLRDRQVTVRGLQSCGQQVGGVSGPARVGVNLRGVAAAEVVRGDALLTESWPAATALLDVTTGPGAGERLPRVLTLHVGTAALPVRTQRLTDGHIRLRLPRHLPLVRGDRAVLRDPGLREVLAGVEVAVVDPPTRHDRRADRRADSRRGGPGEPQPTSTHTVRDAGDEQPAEPGAPAAPAGIRALLGWLAAHPLQAPSREQLDGWTLTARELAEAAGRRQILRLGGLVLAGDALETAEQAVRQLQQPFAVGDATRALGASRRVTVPLLERLDTAMVTRRLPEGLREVRQHEVVRKPVRP